MTFNNSRNSTNYFTFFKANEGVNNANNVAPISNGASSTRRGGTAGGTGNHRTHDNNSVFSGHFEGAPRSSTTSSIGLKILKRPEKKQDDFNLSSSTTVLGNEQKYFGDLNPADLPSPIEDLWSNPLDNQLSSLYKTSATGSSGYASGLQKSSDINSSSNFFNVSLDNFVFTEPTKDEYYQPIAGTSSSAQKYTNSDWKTSSNEQNLNQYSIWRPQEFDDVFANAADSPYLVPKSNNQFKNTSINHSLSKREDEDLIREVRDLAVQDAYKASIVNSNLKLNSLNSTSYPNNYSSYNNSKSMGAIPKNSSRMFRVNSIQSYASHVRTSGQQEGICQFCYNNREPLEECRHHLKDKNGLVTCPVLYVYICDICGATGSYAHTRKHCPKKNEAPAAKKDNTNIRFEKWSNGIVTITDSNYN